MRRMTLVGIRDDLLNERSAMEEGRRGRRRKKLPKNVDAIHDEGFEKGYISAMNTAIGYIEQAIDKE